MGEADHTLTPSQVSVTRINNLFTAGRWRNDWNVDIQAAITGGIVSLNLRASRKLGDWRCTAWETSEIIKIPPVYAPTVGDQNCPAISNAQAGPNSIAVQLNQDNISIRPIVSQTITVGTWIHALIEWSIA